MNKKIFEIIFFSIKNLIQNFNERLNRRNHGHCDVRVFAHSSSVHRQAQTLTRILSRLVCPFFLFSKFKLVFNLQL
jgi:hypothetical protein